MCVGHIPSLDVEEVHPDEFEEDPSGVAGEELPVLAVPATALGDGDGVDVVVDGQGNLDGQVHDEDTLGTELVRENFDGVGDEETGPGECVGDTVQPNEDYVGVADTDDVLGVVLLAGDGRADQEKKHASRAMNC